MKNKVYFPNLNGVRFFAALSVMIYHFWGIKVLSGHLGVVLFFVLSGFLITYLLFKEKEEYRTINVSKFYLRRILRIWPLYFFILAISFFYYFLNNNANDFWKVVPYYLFFIPNLALVSERILHFAGILWSVGSEEQFYFFWPWAIKKIKKEYILYFFIFVIVIFLFVPHGISFINNRYFNNSIALQHMVKLMGRMSFGSMATGAILAYISFYHKKYLKFLFNKYLQILTLAVLLGCWMSNTEFLFNDQFYSILFGILIINFAQNPKVIFSLENKVLNYLGKISYGLYVYHLIAFEFNDYLLSLLQLEEKIPRIIIFIISIVWTITFASISYKFIEKPFLKLKLKKFTIVQSGG